jgi:peptidoglycan/xylan/chitin deacetylase (PgdA/CDA1 family)
MNPPAAFALFFMVAIAAGCMQPHATPAADPPPTRHRRQAIHLAGTLPQVERAVATALDTAGLADRVVRIGADTNGRITVAGVWFTYDAHVLNPLPDLQVYTWDAIRTVLGAVSSVDEVHLSAFHLDDPVFDTNRRDVTYSVAASRVEVNRVGAAPPARAVAALPRVWHHPLLLLAAAKGTGIRTGSETHPRIHREQEPVFQGNTNERAVEAQHRDAGRASGKIVEGKIYRGSPSRHALALTFDDGPVPIYTALLLDTLDRLGLRATMFLIGHRVQQYPYFAREIVGRGHEAANHTFHHVNLTRLTAEGAADEIATAQDVISAVTGRAPRFFRPPGGDYNAAVLRAAANLGLVTVFWTDDPADYARLGPPALESRLLSRISNGGILLLHQGVEDTIRILPPVTEILRKRGFAITTVGSLAAP